MKKTGLWILAVALAMPMFALADDHPLSEIKGTDIDLKVYDHAIAGSIRDFVVFGNKEEGKFKSTLLMKRDGQLIETVFEPGARGAGGVIRQETEERTIETELRLVGMDQENQQITVAVNGEPVTVQIEGEWDGSHFANPSYTAVVNGEEIHFSMAEGHACYGYSTHLIFWILGAYLHN